MIWSAQKDRTARLLLTISLLLASCIRTDMGYVSYRCATAYGLPVSTEGEASLAAQAIWYCMQPKLARVSPTQWRLAFTAEEVDGVWYVSERVPDGYTGGLGFVIRGLDGMLLNYYNGA